MFKLIEKKLPRNLIYNLRNNDLFIFLIQKIYRKLFDFPKTIQLHINTKCNYNCKYCYSKKNIIPKINMGDIIKEANWLGVRHIDFLGGEPLLDEKIKKYLDLCKKQNLNVKIYTNAMILNDKLLKYIKKINNVTLAIKFDDKTSYEKYTQNKAYDKLLTNIKKIKEKKIKAYGHVFIHHENISKIEELLKLSKKIKIRLLFERYIPVGLDIDKKLVIDKEEWNYALRRINKFYKKNKTVFYSNSIIRGNSCGCFIDLISIDIRGNVKPCPLATEEQIIGNIRDNSLLQIWKRYKKKRREWLKIPDECKDCKYKLLCHGGCKTHTYMKNRTYNAKDPLCNQEFIATSGNIGHNESKLKNNQI